MDAMASTWTAQTLEALSGGGPSERRRPACGRRAARPTGLLPDGAGDLRRAPRRGAPGRDRERLPRARPARRAGPRAADRLRCRYRALRARRSRAASTTITSSATAAARSRRSPTTSSRRRCTRSRAERATRSPATTSSSAAPAATAPSLSRPSLGPARAAVRTVSDTGTRPSQTGAAPAPPTAGNPGAEPRISRTRSRPQGVLLHSRHSPVTEPLRCLAPGHDPPRQVARDESPAHSPAPTARAPLSSAEPGGRLLRRRSRPTWPPGRRSAERGRGRSLARTTGCPRRGRCGGCCRR